MVSVLFGELQIEHYLREHDLPVAPRTLDEDGYINPDAYLIARQFSTDIQDMLTLDVAEPLEYLEWRGNIVDLFTEPDAAEAFCSVDVSMMRAAYLRRALAPPGAIAELPSEVAPSDEAEVFVCTLKTSEGIPCMTIWKSARALYAHQRGLTPGGEHGMCCLLSQITVTNECIICGTTFPTRVGAPHHITAAWRSHICRTDQT